MMMNGIQQSSPFFNPQRFNTTKPSGTNVDTTLTPPLLPPPSAWVLPPPDITPPPNNATPISAWQQIATANQTNSIPAGGWKFARTLPNTTEEGINNTPPPDTSSTARKNLIRLYQSFRPKPNANNSGDGKLVVGGQGNFDSIAKNGTSGLFLSTEGGDASEG